LPVPEKNGGSESFVFVKGRGENAVGSNLKKGVIEKIKKGRDRIRTKD